MQLKTAREKLAIDHFKSFIILVTAIITRPVGNVLLVRRSLNSKTFPGFWQMPEGKLELGEQPLHALEREIKEELGCKVSGAKIKDAITLTYPFEGKDFHLLRIIATAKLTGKITLSSEHSEYKWAKLIDLDKTKNLVPGTRELAKTISASHR